MPIMTMLLAVASTSPAALRGQITVDRAPPISKSDPAHVQPRQGEPMRLARARIVLDHMPRELVTYANPPGWSAPMPDITAAPAGPTTLAVSRHTPVTTPHCPQPFYDRVNLTRVIQRGFKIVSWRGAPASTTTDTPEVPIEIIGTDAAGNDVGGNPAAATGIRVRPPAYRYQFPSSRGCISSYYLVITVEGPIGVDPLAATFSRPRHRGPAGN